MISRRILILMVVLLAAAMSLGAYVAHLVRRARAAAPVSAADKQPVAPPAAGPAMPVTLFVANDEDSMLHRQQASAALPAEPAKRAREILHALVVRYEDPGSTHLLGAGADVNDVYLIGSDLAIVDVNTAFADGHPSGILEEDLTLASMAQTLAANVPGIARMKLLVNGKERDTLAGHAGLLEPYAVADAARIIKPPPTGTPAAPGVEARLGLR